MTKNKLKLAKPTKKQIETWVEALRSGEYKQTTGALQDNSGYCCLGVACRVFIPKDDLVLDKWGVMDGGMPKDDQQNAPEWLNDINDDFKKQTGKELVTLNDSDDFTFDMIADMLELVYIHKILEEKSTKKVGKR
jgi:hypothetical protein